MNEMKFLLLSISILYLHCCGSAQNASLYFITATADSSCPGPSGSCLTLDSLALKPVTHNTTLHLLPGTHNLNKDIAVTSVGHFFMFTQYPSGTKIVCTSPSSFLLEEISRLEINNITMVSCGGTESASALHVESVEQFALRGIVILKSLGTAVSIYQSKGVVEVSEFQGSGGVGMKVANSSVSFKESSVFSNNLGGGIDSYDSAIEFDGLNYFTNNTAKNGGGISARRSTVNSRGYTRFMNNSANSGGGLFAIDTSMIWEEEVSFLSNTARNGSGGGIYASNQSTVNIFGEVIFIENVALQYGGGVDVSVSAMLNISGKSSFKSNSATSGGGINVNLGTVNMAGESTFSNNSANRGGGLRAMSVAEVDFQGESRFIGNSAFGYGGGIDVHRYCTLNISGNTSFTNNSARFGGGIYGWRSKINCDGRSYFSNNSADFGGGMCVSRDSTAVLNGENRFMENWCLYNGGGIFVYHSSLRLSGITDFFHNSAYHGGALAATFSKVYFDGSGSLTENFATINGGALSQTGASNFYFSLHSVFDFVQNSAMEFGGAIFIQDNYQLYCASEFTYELDDKVSNIIGVDCSEELEEEVCYVDENSTLFDLNFKDNSAQAGTVLYGREIDKTESNVQVRDASGSRTLHAGDVFDRVSEFDTSHSAIASDPYHVCPCISGQLNCNIPQPPLEVDIYPGQVVSVSLVAVGQRKGPTSAIIHSYYDPDAGAKFSDLESTQKIDATCTTLSYTIVSQRSSEIFKLYAEGPCGKSGFTLSVYVNLLDCPSGFMLSSNGTWCICEKRLERYTKRCHISNQTVTRAKSDYFWVGLYNSTEGLVLHPHCPFDFCHTQTVSSFKFNESDSQCNYNRSGLLCGGCQSDLSLVLGSSKCLKCSNTYLLLLIAFVVAGISLVVLLLVLNLTVGVGTINGLVFYANIFAAVRAHLLPLGKTNVLTVFISWVNLDLGIETCFFDGMDAYTKTWLQFAFPIYVWALVGAIIIISHYSMRISKALGTNTVSVLATLFFLSYAKLLNTIIAIFSFTFLDYSDGPRAVWRNDGNVRFLHGKHIPLFLVALLALIFLFIPFTLLLLFGQCIKHYSEKKLFSWISDYRVKSFLDVYHGPFKIKHRYWSGLLLVLRCCLFLIFTFNTDGDSSVNLLVIALCMSVVALVLSWLKVYESWYLTALELAFIMNLGVLSVGTLYVKSASGNQTALTLTSVGIAFGIFCGIILYHIWFQLNRKGKLKSFFKIPCNKVKNPPTLSDDDNVDISYWELRDKEKYDD